MITSWTSHHLAQITNGTWDKMPADLHVGSVEIDHRQLGETGLFIALAGERRDGHEFLDALSQDQCALVHTPSDKSLAAQLAVSDVLAALHQIAQAAMAETSAQKIAVTGSVGKTSTKEALAHILAAFGHCHASSGNYNNHIGAPLSMSRTPDAAEMIVMEMGMNHAGEIAPLSQLYQGHIAIITKIANSHIGHFTSLKDIAEAKAEIFDGMSSGIAILPFDDAHFALLARRATEQGLAMISFGHKAGADIQITAQRPSKGGQELTIINHLNDETICVTCGLSAPHHSTTIAILLATLHGLGLDWQIARHRFASLQEVAGRGNHVPIKLAGKMFTLINDSYNAGPASMAASLSYMASLPNGEKTLILTDMLELGDQCDEAHLALVPAIEAVGATRLILVGPAMCHLAQKLGAMADIAAHDTLEDALSTLASQPLSCDVVLVKGSHGSGAPQLAQYLIEASEDSTQNPDEARHVS